MLGETTPIDLRVDGAAVVKLGERVKLIYRGALKMQRERSPSLPPERLLPNRGTGLHVYTHT